MRVNEGDFNCQAKTVHLNIMNSRGEIFMVNLSEDTTVETLKNKILSYFRSHKTSQWDNLISFRLISSIQKRSLQDNRTLKEEQIANNDYLIMKKKKSNLNLDKRYSTITKQQIVEATKAIPSRNLDDRAFCVQSNQNNFSKDIREILVVLVDYSEKLLRDHPKVKRIFNLANKLGSDENLTNFLKDDEMDENALQKLTDMGFTNIEHNRQALKSNNMNTVDAINWLLAYESKKDSNELGSKTSLTKESTNDLNSESINELNKTSKRSTFRQTYYDKNEIFENVPKLVESFRRFKRHTFYYNKKSFDNMKKMGFENQQVKDSLWIWNNNESLACEWLLSNRRPKLDELNIGLKRSSPLYNSLFENSIVQLGLLKPKVLFAFLHLLSSNFFNGEPNRWLNEPEMSPIINQIFRIYHSEKPNHQSFIHQTRTCFTNSSDHQTYRTSFEDQYNSDYSTSIIPEILNNLSLNDNRQDWNLTDNATLV